jgi:hypothetical protein
MKNQNEYNASPSFGCEFNISFPSITSKRLIKHDSTNLNFEEEIKEESMENSEDELESGESGNKYKDFFSNMYLTEKPHFNSKRKNSVENIKEEKDDFPYIQQFSRFSIVTDDFEDSILHLNPRHSATSIKNLSVEKRKCDSRRKR